MMIALYRIVDAKNKINYQDASNALSAIPSCVHSSFIAVCPDLLRGRDYALLENQKVMKLRVFHIQNVPSKGKKYPIKSVLEGMVLIDKLAKIDLQNPHIVSNAFGIEVFENGEWCDWICPDCGDNDNRHTIVNGIVTCDIED